jgi:hypothetical protein
MSPRASAVWRASHSDEIVRIGFRAGVTRANARESQMTRQQLEQLREGVEAQIRWAVLHGGDQELLICCASRATVFL